MKPAGLFRRSCAGAVLYLLQTLHAGSCILYRFSNDGDPVFVAAGQQEGEISAAFEFEFFLQGRDVDR